MWMEDCLVLGNLVGRNDRIGVFMGVFGIN